MCVLCVKCTCSAKTGKRTQNEDNTKPEISAVAGRTLNMLQALL